MEKGEVRDYLAKNIAIGCIKNFLSDLKLTFKKAGSYYSIQIDRYYFHINFNVSSTIKMKTYVAKEVNNEVISHESGKIIYSYNKNDTKEVLDEVVLEVINIIKNLHKASEFNINNL